MSEELQEALEEISMLIIANSGAARSAAFEALQAAKKKDFAQADQLMESAERVYRQPMRRTGNSCRWMQKVKWTASAFCFAMHRII